MHTEQDDLIHWLQYSVRKSRFFLFDLTRRPYDTIAITDRRNPDVVKGVIVKTARKQDLGAHWWTTSEDLQTGLEVGYFDLSKRVNTRAWDDCIPKSYPPMIREEFTHDHPVTPDDPIRPKKRR